MRLQILADRTATHDPAHPPLPERLILLQSCREPVHTNGHARRNGVNGDSAPATTLLGDLESLEEMLHNRLFGVNALEPSVFHKIGT
jgi:hypothetical protein